MGGEEIRCEVNQLTQLHHQVVVDGEATTFLPQRNCIHDGDDDNDDKNNNNDNNKDSNDNTDINNSNMDIKE